MITVTQQKMIENVNIKTPPLLVLLQRAEFLIMVGFPLESQHIVEVTNGARVLLLYSNTMSLKIDQIPRLKSQKNKRQPRAKLVEASVQAGLQ